MTTILADVRHGVMVSDSSAGDDDRVWRCKKVFRHAESLIGFSGYTYDFEPFLAWWRGGMAGKRPKCSLSVLILNQYGLFSLDEHSAMPECVPSGREAIGTGGKAAMCAYEALGWSDPRRAVSIVCRHDAASRGPVRVYRLKQGV